MTERYTDGTYVEHNPTWHVEDSPWKAAQIVRIIERNALKPTNICEVGCGAGEILNQLSMRYRADLELFGYEISPHALELCRKKAKGNLRFRRGCLHDDADAFFDIVMAIDVLEHIEDYYGFLRNLRTKAKFKIFHIPLELSAQTVLRSSPLLRSRSAFGHIHYFTKETALEALRDVGYGICDYFYTGTALELPNRKMRTRLMALPRRLAFSMHQDFAVRLFGGYSLMVLAT